MYVCMYSMHACMYVSMHMYVCTYVREREQVWEVHTYEIIFILFTHLGPGVA